MKYFRSAGEIIRDTITELEHMYSSDGKPDISSVIMSPDKIAIGFNNGETVLICGDRLSRKYSLLLTLISELSISGETPCGLISAAMDESDLMTRIISAHSSIETERLTNGLLKPCDFIQLATASEKIFDSRLSIAASSLMTLKRMLMTAREMKNRQSIKILIIDRLELLTVEQYFNGFDHQMEYLSLCLKKLAGELRIPIVATYQSENHDNLNSLFDKVYSIKRTDSEKNEIGTADEWDLWEECFGKEI